MTLFLLRAVATGRPSEYSILNPSFVDMRPVIPIALRAFGTVKFLEPG